MRTAISSSASVSGATSDSILSWRQRSTCMTAAELVRCSGKHAGSNLRRFYCKSYWMGNDSLNGLPRTIASDGRTNEPQTFLRPGARRDIETRSSRGNTWRSVCSGQSGEQPGDFLSRHEAGNWGNLCDEDHRENEFSLAHGFRILSSYSLRNGTVIWLITESDRSSTCFLLPSEY